LWALSCKIPARTALALLSCGRPSRWPPDLLLRSPVGMRSSQISGGQ